MQTRINHIYLYGISKKFKIFTLRSQGLVTFVMSVAVSRKLHNSRIRDLVCSPAVLAPQEDRLASSPNQIAFGRYPPTFASTRLMPMATHCHFSDFSFGCGYLLKHFRANRLPVLFNIAYGQRWFRGSISAVTYSLLLFSFCSVCRSRNSSLRKERDSNPRAISDSHVSSVVLSASQPSFQSAIEFPNPIAFKKNSKVYKQTWPLPSKYRTN